MRPCVFTLAGAYLFLFLCLPAHGQTSSKVSSGHTQKAGEDKDPIAIVELGAATSWNFSGGHRSRFVTPALRVTVFGFSESSHLGLSTCF